MKEKIEIPGYRLVVSGDTSEDGLFDLCHSLHERGVFWILQRFVNGEMVDEEWSSDFADRIADFDQENEQIMLDLFRDQIEVQS